jgi:hypothetical protein
MPIESFILVIDQSTLTYGTATSEKKQGAGYHNKRSSLHSCIYILEDYQGNIRLQGTLVLDPAEEDWVDISNSEFVGDLTTNIINFNFSGNFIWIRAVYKIESGKIWEIRYNH